MLGRKSDYKWNLIEGALLFGNVERSGTYTERSDSTFFIVGTNSHNSV